MINLHERTNRLKDLRSLNGTLQIRDLSLLWKLDPGFYLCPPLWLESDFGSDDGPRLVGRLSDRVYST